VLVQKEGGRGRGDSEADSLFDKKVLRG
jgi:hypothetical protein